MEDEGKEPNLSVLAQMKLRLTSGFQGVEAWPLCTETLKMELLLFGYSNLKISLLVCHILWSKDKTLKSAWAVLTATAIRAPMAQTVPGILFSILLMTIVMLAWEVAGTPCFSAARSFFFSRWLHRRWGGWDLAGCCQAESRCCGSVNESKIRALLSGGWNISKHFPAKISSAASH